ncbi:MAG: 4-hydroxybutyrate CoA-transferase [Lentisphaerae bacterium RIFOXYB12_FULL_65_16]|nr:MAG: 4-hydroxybutyrate CoA-transferase [Lentisphaerae bacterium RIFOXYA12_64_32]OGV85352.1 MAG: 4-hydroxybutyrate CoA-transferase [Lentisphaerae bacterium RIFOXYB12_FULL_65_16]
MDAFDWKKKHASRVRTAIEAMRLIRPGHTIFIGTGCAQPRHLVNVLVEEAKHVADAHIIQLLTIGDAPYATEAFRDRFKMNSFFIADNVRHAFDNGIGDYTPMFLADIPQEFESGRIPIDVALVSVTPPDVNGLCSLGVSVDVVKSAAANAKFVIAQVNANMPRTLGNSFLHVNNIDALVPYDEPMITVEPPASTDVLRKIGQNIARLVENGSTIECGIGRIPQALAEFLHEKKDLGVHTEMFGDWIIELIECGAITCAKKTINRNKIVASFCMGSQKLYDYIDNNPLFEFHPTEYVNDPFVISQHDKMVGINVGLEIDLTGQVCADSLGYRFYSGIGGQVDFIRGCARSREGKPIIALPSTAKGDTVSRVVAKLTEGAGVVTTRGDVHYVVTEYGIAYLHGKTIRERALALINIAHPKFRHELIHAAKAQRYVQEDQIELAWEQAHYPEELERHDTLRDGTQIFFRPVKPTDEAALSEMLYSLSADSVKKRYFTHTKTFPHKDVQRLTNIDYHNDLAIVGVVPSPAGDEIVAIAQYFLDPKTQVAEVAFIVQDEWQDKGMGSYLLTYIGRIGTQRGIRTFYATVLPENKAMLNIFHNSGYKVNTEFDGEAYSLSLDLAAHKETTHRE